MAEIRLDGFPKAVTDAAHAIGLNYKKPYFRHGRMFYKPYRNRFATSPSGEDYKTWMLLESDGRAGSASMYEDRETSARYFWLTRKGLDWLGEVLGMTIYDEED